MQDADVDNAIDDVVNAEYKPAIAPDSRRDTAAIKVRNSPGP